MIDFPQKSTILLKNILLNQLNPNSIKSFLKQK